MGATIIDSGSGLNCYQCNSYEHALCADPFHHELHLCDCRPLHHGAWIPDTLDHPQLSTTQSGGRDRIQQTLKNFPRKKSAVTTRQICSISDAAFEYENLRLSKSSLAATHAFSLELLSTQSLGFCSATRL